MSAKSPTLYLDCIEEPGLLTLLHNSLILSRVAPNLPTASIIALASTSRSLRTLVYRYYPGVTFRYVDFGINCNYIELSKPPTPWHCVCLRENEKDWRKIGYHHEHQFSEINSINHCWVELITRAFYRFGLKNVFSFVTTLILDGLVDVDEVLNKILFEDSYNIRILSIRGIHTDSWTIAWIIRDLINPSLMSSHQSRRKLKALYYFTPLEGQLCKVFTGGSAERQPDPNSKNFAATASAPLGILAWTFHQDCLDERAQDKFNEEWALLLIKCRRLIAFDAIVCYHGPRSTLPPRLANIALGPEGCQNCHSAPEEPFIFDYTPQHELPLLLPVPLYASTVKAAQSLGPYENKKFYARCTACMKDRRCEMCNAWWCENCYKAPGVKVHNGLCVQRCPVR